MTTTSTNANLSIVTQWSHTELDSTQSSNLVSDVGMIAHNYEYSSGTGHGQINVVYHDIHSFVAGSPIKRYYLNSGLDQEFLDETDTVSFSGVKSLTIKSSISGSHNEGENLIMQLSGASASGWTHMINDDIDIGIGGIWHMSAGTTGWPVETGNQEIALQPINVGDGSIDVEILILGTL